MNTTLKTLTAAALATALIAGFAVGHSAGAAESAPAPSRTISYADLDLSTQDGAATLYQRIDHAAKAICRGIYPTQNLDSTTLRKDCIREAVEKAVQTVDAPRLTALYEGRDVRMAQNR